MEQVQERDSKRQGETDRQLEWSVMVGTFQRVSVSHLAADEDMISDPE